MLHQQLVRLIKPIAVLRFRIVGNSMYPGFKAGTHVLARPAMCHLKGYSRGEVVIVSSSECRSFNYFKRIVGLPGEQISLAGNNIYINDQLLNEPYVYQNHVARNGSLSKKTNSDIYSIYILASNEYFMLGDNRLDSTDSRTLGPFNVDQIIGKPWFRYWPPREWGFIRKVEYLAQ